MDPLSEALAYHALGWSIVPVNPKTKKPSLLSWKNYQKRRPTEKKLREWFSSGEKGLAIILGEVSGGLICRDYDQMEAYDAWAREYRDLAATLPTVATGRGRHVYCTVDLPELLSSINGTNFLKLGDGELRVSNVVCILPPSIHPEGKRYRWVIRPTGEIPHCDPYAAGLLKRWTEGDGSSLSLNDSENPESLNSRISDDIDEPDPPPDLRKYINKHGQIGWMNVARIGKSNRRRTANVTERDREYPERQRITEKTEAMLGVPDGSSGMSEIHSVPPLLLNLSLQKSDESISADILTVIQGTLPNESGVRHRQVFELARGLKGIPSLFDADPKELKPMVRIWHRNALDKIKTKAFEESWIDFLNAWPRVKFPAGSEPIAELFREACQTELPEFAFEYEQDGLRKLVLLCRELQRVNGGDPFYLGVRTAQRLLGLPNAMAAQRWLFLLRIDGVIEVVTKGGIKFSKPKGGGKAKVSERRASRYRYRKEL